MIMAILPGGAAIIAVPVGIAHILVGNVWAGLIVIGGTLTFVASLANQIRPRLVSKEAYLNRAFVLLSVFSGVALLGTMGIVYGPLIMILFTTILEVYLQYYRPGPPEVTIENTGDAPSVEAREKGGDEVNP
jgi:predicted PurR-regulated permease PerM